MSAISNYLNMTQPTIQESLRAVPAPAQSVGEPTLWQWLTADEPKRFMLPLTGLWILGLDWLLFSQEIMTVGLATPIIGAVGFLFGSCGTFVIQRFLAGESNLKAAAKAVAAGMVVGVPIPLAGSAVGGWILIASGLHSIKDRMLKKS